MKKDEFKKKIKKFSKDEIIEALTNTLFLYNKYDYILQSARDIKFERLMKESEKISLEIDKLIETKDKDKNNKDRINRLLKIKKLSDKQDKIQKEIDKVLNISKELFKND